MQVITVEQQHLFSWGRHYKSFNNVSVFNKTAVPHISNIKSIFMEILHPKWIYHHLKCLIDFPSNYSGDRINSLLIPINSLEAQLITGILLNIIMCNKRKG